MATMEILLVHPVVELLEELLVLLLTGFSGEAERVNRGSGADEMDGKAAWGAVRSAGARSINAFDGTVASADFRRLRRFSGDGRKVYGGASIAADLGTGMDRRLPARDRNRLGCGG